MEELGLHIPFGRYRQALRKAGREELILPLPAKSSACRPIVRPLHLLQTVRDESHRFAITGHRKKRDKARVTSSLSEIPGIGSKRRQALLTRFGGLRGGLRPVARTWKKVEGISKALAETIYEHLH